MLKLSKNENVGRGGACKFSRGQMTLERDQTINKKCTTLRRASRWRWVFQHMLDNVGFSRELESQSLASKQLLRCQLCSPPLCCAILAPNGFQFLTKHNLHHICIKSEWPFFNLGHFSSWCILLFYKPISRTHQEKKNVTAQQ